MIKRQVKNCALATLALGFLSVPAYAQSSLSGAKISTITTGVPFLRIGPDARGGSMGDCGIATDADVNGQHWNIGKMAMNEKNQGLSLTYTPWLRDLVPDINLAYLSYFRKFGEENNQSFSASLRYFNLGQIDYKDQFAIDLGTGYPREYAVDAGYSRKLSNYMSAGVTFRLIHSNIANGPSAVPGSQQVNPATTFGTDIGWYYKKPLMRDGEETGNSFAAGAVISNLGGKVSYNQTRRDFLPTNLGLGAAYTHVIDEFNKITGTVEMNKLLVPSLDERIDSTTGNTIFFYRENVSVINGVFSSFRDAPGGTSEEFREIQWSGGAEYSYQNQFFARAGYFYEHATKGARQYATCGLGFKYNVFQLNFSYLVPSGSGIARNPLSNTLRFSLMFDFDKIAKKKEEDESRSEE
jgi:hypothetical protein